MKVQNLFLMILAMVFVESCSGVKDEVRESDYVGDTARVVVSFVVNAEQLGGSGLCDKNSPNNSADHGTNISSGIPGSRSIANPGTDTDEGVALGYVPRDVWVIQYNGVGDDALLSGNPRYVEFSGAVAIQAVASMAVNTLIFVANTHDATLEWGDIATLGKFKRASREIKGEGDCYGNNFSSHKDLILSGKYEGPIVSGAISAELFRNIARLDFTLRNGAGSSMTLQSVQLCNVSKDFYYAAGIIAKDVLFPTVINYFDYPPEVLSVASVPGGTESFVFYMPVNQRGVVAASTSSKTKAGHAPSYSSYIKIVALDPGGQAYTYKVYPGANVVNDYNISANNRYALDLTINAPGDATTDGRVETYGQQDFESANAFILNPSPVGSKARVFTVPIDKVNEFWQDVDNTLMIEPSDAWTVELIWQDTPTPNCIGFVDLNNPSASPSAVFHGFGPDQRVALTAKSGSEGNVLIGLKKVGREGVGYLWSWHLWVTDYDPTYTAAADLSQFVYSVPGGAVHRYQGDIWTQPGGKYYTKYIMDRNLGARHAGYSTVGALYYQFGRKDPFPCINYGNALYDINGVELPITDPRNANRMYQGVTTGVTLATGVLNPTYYYYKISSAINGGDWTSQGRPSYHPWNDPIEGIDRKSIFDPCPRGWKIPLISFLYDFVIEPLTPSLSTALDVARDPKLGWEYNGPKGLRYWPKDRLVEGEIFYPATGQRFAESGHMMVVDNVTYQWSAEPCNYSPTYGYYFEANMTGTVRYPVAIRAYGLPVRCVQE